MSQKYNNISKPNKGAWVVHHGQKTSAYMGAGAQFPALEVAGKAASLLSQFAASDQAVITKARMDALAMAAGLNPLMEVPILVSKLKQRRFIEISSSGDIEVLGLTSALTVQHASDLFDAESPSNEERATIALAEISSNAPVEHKLTHQFIQDEFKIASAKATELLRVSEEVGFVDSEGTNQSKLYFNGNLFRRDNIEKVNKVLSFLSTADNSKVGELGAKLDAVGCLSIETTERILGQSLFEKLRAAGMYDINHVANPSGEFGFVTKPAAFHKFNNPMSDDAFDLAKVLVAALTYGMTQSTSSRGRISAIWALLSRLTTGQRIGPATAIGEDYRILEMKGVIKVQKAPSYGYFMSLLKRDIGEMALAVLTTGETASVNSLNNVLPGSMTAYVGPEETRSKFRRSQLVPGKKRVEDVLQALRQEGGF